MSEKQVETRVPYILVAPNGARRGHRDHPALPVSIDETISAACACHAAGADGLHLHIRDSAGVHTLDSGHYREAVAELHRRVPELDVQITTESAGVFDVRAQLGCIRQVVPTWASISVREIAREPEMAPQVYGLCADQGTRVQHILYNAADAELLSEWQKQGVVRPEQVDRLLVLGRYATAQESQPSDIDAFPTDPSPWMVCAFGRMEHACLLGAAARGADVRVGFENSLMKSDGTVWHDNAASVAALMARLKGH